MRVALDTNILVYAEGVDGAERRSKAVAVLRPLPAERVLIPVQVLGELMAVLVRKQRRTRQQARATVDTLTALYGTIDTTADVFREAVALCSEHGFQIWDAVILSAAAEAGCAILLSEDMQDGFVWRGVTICNPFAPDPHPLLASLLAGR